MAGKCTLVEQQTSWLLPGTSHHDATLSSDKATEGTPLFGDLSPEPTQETPGNKNDSQPSTSSNSSLSSSARPTLAGEGLPNRGISKSITGKLYVSHFLSAWNSRGFEFGAILFLATIYPGTLLPMSVYALVRAASAIILAPGKSVV